MDNKTVIRIANKIAKSNWESTGIADITTNGYDDYQVENETIGFKSNGVKYTANIDYMFSVENDYRPVWTGVRDTEEWVGFSISYLEVSQVYDIWRTGESEPVDINDPIYKKVKDIEDAEFKKALTNNAENKYNSIMEQYDEEDYRE